MFKVRKLPKTFTVRFMPSTLQLLDAILESWEAIVTYMKESDNKNGEKKRGGFACVWTDCDFLRRCCVLRDKLYVFSRFQQRTQDNDLLLIDIATNVGHVCERQTKC